MKKIKLLLLVLLLAGCIFYTNILDQKENVMNDNEQEYSGNKEETSKILLYFLDSDNNLVPEYRFVSIDDLKNDIPKLIVNELLKGSTLGHNNAIPKGTSIISIETIDDIVRVNFTKEFKNDNSDTNYNLKIEALTKSLTEIKEINMVEILVEGESYELRGRTDL